LRPACQPELVNGPLGDPALYVEVLFERRGLLFDLGDIQALATRRILRLSHVFVSHAHMDHFVGFDHVLRVCLGREHALHLFGPAGFVEQVGHKLAAYTWNLVESYATDFTVVVTELLDETRARYARFRCRSAFALEDLGSHPVAGGVLLDEDALRVRVAVLDHRTPSLAFRLEEKEHINIWRNRLDELGLPVGAWLRELKAAVRQGRPDDTAVRAWWRAGGQIHERWLPLGLLRERALRVVPGQSLGYVADAIYHAENARRIVDLVRGADLLYIEASFLSEAAERAAETYHLTAAQAGRIARLAGVRRVVPFHFSARYAERAAEIDAEVQAAFAGG
jgi:ribonuclease Z